MSKYSKVQMFVSAVAAVLVLSVLLLLLSIFVDLVGAVGVSALVARAGMATRALLFLVAISMSVLFSVSAFTFLYDRVVWVIEKALPFGLLDSEDWSTLFLSWKRERERDRRIGRDGRNRDRDRLDT